MKKAVVTRRKALAGFGSAVAASPLLADEAPKVIGEPPLRIAPRADLVNVLEFEDVAQRKLAAGAYASIAGSDRSCFDRITFRPRMMSPTSHLDLSVALFGDKMFAPVLVGPVAKLQNYHPDGELAMVRAASAAKSWMVVSSESSVPIEKIAAESKTTLWYQVFAEGEPAAVRAQIDQAIKAGCKAVCITVGSFYRNADQWPSLARLAATPHPGMNWEAIDQIRKGISVPVLIKGILTPQEAAVAVKRGIQGLVVSNYGGLLMPGAASPMEMLPSIADSVGGKAAILIDGNFRRGSDIFKALAYGATAVMLGRPAVWGLAAYGQDGAQGVLEMLQTEIGRDMAHCGKATIKDIDRTVVKTHEV